MTNFVQATNLFLKQFNCACYRILSKPHRPLLKSGGISLITCGIQNSTTSRCWEVLPHHGSYHPLALMLSGRHKRLNQYLTCPSLSSESQRVYGLPMSLDSFLLGFQYTSLADIWGQDIRTQRSLYGDTYNDSHCLQHQSNYFNFGRAFYYKFFGKYMHHVIPPPFDVTFDKLVR